MLQILILSFFVGLFGANGVPHFVKGIMKESYPCAFGNSPVPNLIAGWASFIIAVSLSFWVNVEQYSIISLISGALGVLIIGLFHAWHGAFGRKS
jgi:hypothetical protein